MTAYSLLDHSIYDKLNEANITVERKMIAAGELILKHGDVSSSIYIIEKGQASVFILQERKVELATLGEQQFFGEMSCLTGDPVSANVEALTELQLVALNRDGLMLLMDEHTEFRVQLIEAMVQRIKSSNDRVLEEHQKNVLMMQLHEEEEQHRYGDLVGESDEIKKVRLAIPKIANESIIVIEGERGTEKLAIARKIHEQSEAHLYPFVSIDSEHFDVKTFESKLLVAKSGTKLILLTTEKLQMMQAPLIEIAPLRERLDDIPLIAQSILQKLDGPTEELLSEEAYRMLSLYPYLTNNVKELENVLREAVILSEGRTIYGKHLKFGRERKPGERPKIGFAFGSGSARGLAHLGGWKEIEDAQIPIDLVAGTSIGSVIAGAIAYGLKNEEAVRMMNNLKWSQIVRPTFPVKSFVQNAPLVQLL